MPEPMPAPPYPKTDYPVTDDELIEAIRAEHRPHSATLVSNVRLRIARARQATHGTPVSDWEIRLEPALRRTAADGRVLIVQGRARAARRLGVTRVPEERTRILALPEHAEADAAAYRPVVDAADQLAIVFERAGYRRPWVSRNESWADRIDVGLTVEDASHLAGVLAAYLEENDTDA